MARPTFLTIANGLEGWDAEVNANTGIFTDGPWPLYEHAAGGAITLAAFQSVFAPASYDRSVAMLNESTRGWVMVVCDGTNWRVMEEPRVVALTDAASVAVNAALLGPGGTGRVTLAGNRTLANPTNPTDGQRIVIEVKQDGVGSKTLAYDTKYRFSTDLPSPTLTTTADKTDFLTFQYNSTADKWDMLAVNKGF